MWEFGYAGGRKDKALIIDRSITLGEITFHPFDFFVFSPFSTFNFADDQSREREVIFIKVENRSIIKSNHKGRAVINLKKLIKYFYTLFKNTEQHFCKDRE